MMLDRKSNEHTAREMILKKAKHKIFGSVCSDSSMSFGKINGAKANLLGRLFGRLSFLYVGVSLSWKCCRHVATCRRRHNVSLQFWPDGSVSPTQNLRCRGSLCRLEPTFPKFLEFVCRNILWYGSTYTQYYSTLIISWFCYLLPPTTDHIFY